MAKETKNVKATKVLKAELTEKAYSVLKRPLITEKTTNVAENSKVVFEVEMKATKKDIMNAITAIYGVQVVSVNTLIKKGKIKSFRGVKGCRSDIKKAYITLEKDANIDIFAGIK